MSCRQIDDWLISSGDVPLQADLAEHVRTCASCEAMVSASVSGAVNPAVSAKIRGAIAKDTKAVRPLPGTMAMGAIFFAVCWVIAVGGGTAAGPHGFHLLTQVQRVSIFGVLASLILLGALLAARSMRPAAGRLYGGWAAPIALLTLEIVFITVFQDYDASHFMHAGLVCLGIGSAFAVPTTFLTWLVMRRGLVVETGSAGMLAGLVGGVAGLSMLEVHCPLLTVPHVSVWHVAVVVVGLLFGGCLGLRDNRSSNAAA